MLRGMDDEEQNQTRTCSRSHEPKEICVLSTFFSNTTVESEKFRQSPIAKGDLEDNPQRIF